MFPELPSRKKEADKIKVELSKMILDRRYDLGLMQKDLADRMVVEPSLVSKWKSGEYVFSVSELSEAFTALGMRLMISKLSSMNLAAEYIRCGFT